MFTCESCGAKTTSLFNCACRRLICAQCKQGAHQEHVNAMTKPQGKDV